MGNIGHSQGLDELVRMFEDIDDPAATLVITGSGMAEEEVRAEIRSDRIQMLGVVDDARLDRELSLATAGIVSQRSDIVEFNVPSKLMNYMIRGLPVVALARDGTEVSRIVEAAKAGWVVSGPCRPRRGIRSPGRRRPAPPCRRGRRATSRRRGSPSSTSPRASSARSSPRSSD